MPVPFERSKRCSFHSGGGRSKTGMIGLKTPPHKQVFARMILRTEAASFGWTRNPIRVGRRCTLPLTSGIKIPIRESTPDGVTRVAHLPQRLSAIRTIHSAHRLACTTLVGLTGGERWRIVENIGKFRPTCRTWEKPRNPPKSLI